MKITAGLVRSMMVLAIPVLLFARDARERSASCAWGSQRDAGRSGTVAPAAAPGPALDGPARSAGADAGWWRKVAAQIEREEYRASRNARGLQAPNRAQNLRTWFRRGGIDVTPRQGAAEGWRFSWRTARWGRPGRMEALPQAAVEPEAQGARVTYTRPGLTEWYQNAEAGLEQGFTVTARPRGEGSLWVVGRLEGTLHAKLRGSEAVELLDARGECVLRYGELQVWDARGAEVKSRMHLAGDELAILIEDHHAVYPLTVDPLLTSPAWTAECDQDSANFGISVAGAGDVNGDGYSDVIVGASMYDNGQTDEGRAFVYHGSANGLALAAAWTAESEQDSAHFGISVAGAGDVNGDGYSDVIVGAPMYNNGQANEGRAFVYHGSATGILPDTAWTAESNQANANFGISVAGAGDVNGDGYSDVIVGANLYDNGQTNEGRAYVYHGSATGLAFAAAWTGESNQSNANFGISVAGAGNVNGDAYSDVIVGANLYDGGQTNEGRAFAYLGSATGLALAAAWTTESNQASANFGIAVAGAGDVNGDGYSDVIVGAYLYDGGQTDEGRAYAYHGSATGLLTTSAWTAESDQASAGFGVWVASAGDVNGDGYSDVIVGAHLYDNGQIDEGRAYSYRGSVTGLALAASWTAESDQAGAGLGISVAGAGDVNGDGYSDVIVGAYLYDGGQFNEGRALAYHGAAGGLALTPAWTVESNQGYTRFGISVAGAGDVNGDGYSDVIVGADLFDNGQTDEGRAFAYHGSASGLALTPAWTAESDQSLARFGISVAGAGDVNGDGYSDVIVGAHMFDNGQTDEGRVFVYHGSATGLALAPAWTAESDQGSAFFGISVASAGDINGDGYSDIIVGAYRYDHGETDEGRAFVYTGSATGLAPGPAWTGESDQPGANFGISVAGAGDVNGDGLSDVIVGAYRYDNDQTDEGRTFVYHDSAGGLALIPTWTAESNQAGASFGISVAGAGDVNGDGYSDVIVGASTYDNGQLDEGRAWVYRGSASGLALAPDWTAESDQPGASFGISVASAGDINSDGYSDVIVGAHRYDNGQTDEGRVFAYHGAASGLALAATWIAESDQYGANFGVSVAGAGDVNGDGYSDALVGASLYDNGQISEGRAAMYYGNGGDGLDRIARQARTDDSAPISIFGTSNSNDGFRLKALGRTPAGRGRVRMQCEIKPAGTGFNGAGLVTGPAFDTGVPGVQGSRVELSELVAGLNAGSLYHWRMRIVTDSPLAPYSPWLRLQGNRGTEADLRTHEPNVEVGNPPRAGPRLWLEHAVPNPFRVTTELRYALPTRGSVRVAVYDVSGRQVAVLVAGDQEAGTHVARWDGHDGRGDQAAPGVYYVQLEFAGRTASQKIVRAR